MHLSTLARSGGGGSRIGNGKGRPKCAQDTRPLNSNLYKVIRDERAIVNPVCGWSTPADVGEGGGGVETLKDMALSVRIWGVFAQLGEPVPRLHIHKFHLHRFSLCVHRCATRRPTCPAVADTHRSAVSGRGRQKPWTGSRFFRYERRGDVLILRFWVR